jgi:hypothetical protein
LLRRRDELARHVDVPLRRGQALTVRRVAAGPFGRFEGLRREAQPDCERLVVDGLDVAPRHDPPVDDDQQLPVAAQELLHGADGLAVVRADDVALDAGRVLPAGVGL